MQRFLQLYSRSLPVAAPTASCNSAPAVFAPFLAALTPDTDLTSSNSTLPSAVFALSQYLLRL